MSDIYESGRFLTRKYATITSEVVVAMENPNVLISIAHVAYNSNDPYHVFEEYVKYCMDKSSKRLMTVDEVQEAVEQEFGIHMPKNVLLRCLKNLEIDGSVSLDQKSNCITFTGIFDRDTFDKDREKFRKIETTVVDDLVAFVRRYQKKWDYNFARNELIRVLDGEHLAYHIQAQNSEGDTHENLAEWFSDLDQTATNWENEGELSDSCPDDQPMFPPRIFVGKFIQEVLQEDSSRKDYLVRICEGLLICAGAYQLSSNSDYLTKPMIRGTEFYFDTKLLLRVLGCAGKAAVEATCELVNMIQSEGGKIYYYPQTLEEICGALGDAQSALEQGGVPADYEMRLFAAGKTNAPLLLPLKQAGVKKELAAKSIFLKPHTEYSDSERLRFGFDKDDLAKFIVEADKGWRARPAENDAMSIWETHMHRRGDYSDYYGGQDRLSIFVTSNVGLYWLTSEYGRRRGAVHNIAAWRRNRLPVITDIRLTCRLWSPATDAKKVPLLQLSANAVAAQKPTRKYYEELSRIAQEVKNQMPEYQGLCLEEFFDDKLTDKILTKVGNEESKLDIGIVSSSLEDITEAKAVREEEKTKAVIGERDKAQDQLMKQTQNIIDDALQRYKNKLPIKWKIIATVSLNWELTVAVVIAVVTVIAAMCLESLNPVWGNLLSALLVVVEKLITKGKIRRGIIKAWFERAENDFATWISAQLTSSEKPYQDRIVQQCLENNEILITCRKALNQPV